MAAARSASAGVAAVGPMRKQDDADGCAAAVVAADAERPNHVRQVVDRGQRPAEMERLLTPVVLGHAASGGTIK